MNLKTISRLSLVVFSLFLMTNMGAQELTDVKVGILTFESDVIDYGTIEQNENGLRAFKFTNTGNAPLVISKVKSSCGCTVASKPNQPILPGESAQIEVNYDTKRVGTFTKSITVFSNAREPSMNLKIKGTIKKGSS